MKPPKKVTVSSQPPRQRPGAAERRAAEVERIADRQATLKREAAERRASRGD